MEDARRKVLRPRWRFLDWVYAHFVKADLLSRFTAFREAEGGLWMPVNEAHRGDSIPNFEHGETERQAVNMAPLGWVPVRSRTLVARGAIRPGLLAMAAMAIRRMIGRPGCKGGRYHARALNQVCRNERREVGINVLD